MQPLATHWALCGLFAVWLCGAVLAQAADAQREQPAAVAQPWPEHIEQLAREYRIVVYNSFRLDRAEYERRREAWQQVQAAWMAAGAAPQHEAQLIDWLRSATQLSQSGQVGPLPAVPEFAPVLHPRSAPAESAAELPVSSIIKQPIATLPPSPLNSAPSAPSSDKTADKPTVKPTVKPPVKLPAPEPVKSPVVTPAAPLAEFQPPVAPALTQVPPVAPRVGRVAPDAATKLAERVGIVPSAPATTPRWDANETARQRQQQMQQLTVIPPRKRAPTGAARMPVAASPAAQAPASASQAPGAQPLPPKSASAPHPSAAPAYVARRPVEATRELDNSEVRINLVELAARINGYNRELQALETQLLTQAAWNVRQLARAVADLQHLAEIRDDATLYLGLLEAESRATLQTPLTLDRTRELLEARIAGLREVLADESDGRERDWQIDSLDALRRQLPQ